MKSAKFLLVLIFALMLISSCATDKFYICRSMTDAIEVQKINGVYNVEQINENTIQLQSKAIVSLRRPEMTQIQADLTIRVLEGDGVRIYLRSTPHTYKTAPNLTLDLTSEGWTLVNNGEKISEGKSNLLEKHQPVRIKLINDGKFSKLILDCDDIYHQKVEQFGTEYIILESLGSVIEVTGIKIEENM